MSGCSRSNCGSSFAITSPSRPIAHTVTVRCDADGDPQPAVHAPSSSAATLMMILQPAALEAGALETPPDVLIIPHDAPDEVAAVVLEHGENRPLVDAEIVLIEPARRGRSWRAAAHGEIEGIAKAVGRVDGVTEAPAHLECHGDDDLRGERQRADGRGRRDGAIIERVVDADAPGGVAVEAARLVIARLRGLARTLAGRESPEVFAIPLPVPGILDRVALLGVGGAATVLEVVEAALAHV